LRQFNLKHKRNFKKSKVMTNLIALIALFVLLSGSSITVSAQVTASATGTAKVITPIQMSNSGDLNFGIISVNPSSAGTVILTPDNVRSATGGVTLPVAVGTFNSASFEVSGISSSTYAITLPPTACIISNGSNSITVDKFTSTPSGTGALSNGGSQTINVGATLNVSAGQVAGTYTNGTGFPIKVNYN
jgi:hypothetical protein